MSCEEYDIAQRDRTIGILEVEIEAEIGRNKLLTLQMALLLQLKAFIKMLQAKLSLIRVDLPK